MPDIYNKLVTTHSMNYKEELKAVEAEIDMCERVISGKIMPEGLVDKQSYEERLKVLRRYRGSIIDKPQLREGIFENYIIR